MKKTFKNLPLKNSGAALWAALSFLLPAAVITAVAAVCSVAPFGDGTLVTREGEAWFDSFSGMYQALVSGKGVFYDINVGFGSSLYSRFAMGLCSPFLLPALLFGQKNLASAYTVITVLRTGSAGAAAWYMLRKCVGTGSAMSFALSCGYSLCGFSAFAAYCPSVADGVVFLPLLVVGIYVFVRESRPIRLFFYGALFFLTCSRLILPGVILSFVMYAVFFMRKASRRQRVYKTAMFAATVLCAAAVPAVLVLPAWAGSRGGVFREVAANDLISDLCMGGYGTASAGGVGLCLAGLLIMGFFAFLCNKSIRAGEKLAAASGMAVILLCHAIPFAARYTLGFCNLGGELVNAGFMTTLIALYCTARCVTEYEGIPLWGIGLSAGVYFLLLVTSWILRGGNYFALLAEVGLAVFAGAVLLQLAYGGDQTGLKIPCAAAAALALFGALHCGGSVSGLQPVVTASYLEYVAESRAQTNEELERSYSENHEEFPSFYRTRSTDGVTESVDINRNGVDGLTAFAERIGIMRGSQFGGADNFTAFSDVLFGIARPDYSNHSGNYVCSPAYRIGNGSRELPDGLNAFETQNYLALEWFGEKVFEPTEPDVTTHELSSENERYRWTFGDQDTAVDSYTFNGGGDIYMLVPGRDYSYAVGSDSRSEWRQGCRDGIFSLSGGEGGGTVTVYISYKASEEPPRPVFARQLGGLFTATARKGANYISFRGSTLRFVFDSAKPENVITSIPFESGWEITVNGSRVEPIEMYGGLTGIRIGSGRNSVVMKYTPQFFRVSLWISAIMLLLGSYITIRVEHDAARRRKVRMAFRAVELNISRLTLDDMKENTDGEQETEARETLPEPVSDEKKKEITQNKDDKNGEAD